MPRCLLHIQCQFSSPIKFIQQTVNYSNAYFRLMKKVYCQVPTVKAIGSFVLVLLRFRNVLADYSKKYAQNGLHIFSRRKWNISLTSIPLYRSNVNPILKIHFQQQRNTFSLIPNITPITPYRSLSFTTDF